MKQQALQPGEVIFREGEKSGEAYGIISGEVQISVDTKEGARVLSQLYPGEIFGEMGMMDDKPRCATAIASKETVIQVITKDKFIEYLMSDTGRLSAYLGTVFERLRGSDLKLKMAPQQEAKDGYNGRQDHSIENLFSGKTSEEEGGEPRLTIRLVSAIPSSDSHEVVLERFPFRIGRLDVSGEGSPSESNALSIPDQKPFQISRSHCSIEEHSGRYFVRDRGSTLGTVVNGNRLSINHMNISQELVQGENTIVLGRDDSPHIFRIIVT